MRSPLEPRKAPAKVVFISLYTEMGGGEVALYHLLRGLDRAKIQPVIFVNARGPFVEKVEALGIDVVVVPFETVMLSRLIRPRHFWNLVLGSRAVRGALKEQQADIVHCSDVLALLLAGVAVLRQRIPVMYSVIFFYEWQRMMVFMLLAIPLVRKIVSNSDAIKRDLLRKTVFLSRKVETLYPSVDCAQFRPRTPGEPDRLRPELGLGPDARLIGVVARFEPSKGHIHFLHAFSRVLAARRDETSALLVGGLLFKDVFPMFARYRDSVLECRRSLDLEERVRILPHRDDMPALMRNLSLLVLPSVNEGFGLVILEALASGVPVVASRTAGAMELVGEYPGVFAAEPGDSGSLAGAIGRALDFVDARQGKPIDPPAPLLRSLSWEKYAENVQEYYAALAA